MQVKSRQAGFTLIEMTVVIAIIVVLTGLSLPALRALFNSCEREAGAHALISSALTSARAIAAREQKYAGIRFQKTYNHNNPDDIIAAQQYLIFVIYDADLPHGKEGNLGCKAVEGTEPVKLPGNIEVTDLKLGDRDTNNEVDIGADGQINEDDELINATTFTILFAPSGKLVIHQLWVINRDGEVNNNTSEDDIFNTEQNVRFNGVGNFIQDDDPAIDGRGIERSRNRFYIYDKAELAKFVPNRRWTDYFSHVEADPVHINPYTGTIIRK